LPAFKFQHFVIVENVENHRKQEKHLEIISQTHSDNKVVLPFRGGFVRVI
jgi:hypothetical protein